MKSKDEISQYAPWEKEGEKKQRIKRGVPAKSNQKSRIRSKLKIHDQDFLDLYLMAREKDRLEGYGRTLGERQKAIAKRWKEVKQAMRNITRSLSIGEEGIEELLESKKKKRENKKKKQDNIQKIDWNY